MRDFFSKFEPQKAAWYRPAPLSAPAPGTPDTQAGPAPMRGSLAVFQSNVSLARAPGVMDGVFPTPTPNSPWGQGGCQGEAYSHCIRRNVLFNKACVQEYPRASGPRVTSVIRCLMGCTHRVDPGKQDATRRGWRRPCWTGHASHPPTRVPRSACGRLDHRRDAHSHSWLIPPQCLLGQLHPGTSDNAQGGPALCPPSPRTVLTFSSTSRTLGHG